MKPCSPGLPRQVRPAMLVAIAATVVAEGVENPQTAVRLREFGCDLAQGFHHSPPIGAAAVVELLTSHGQRSPHAADAIGRVARTATAR